ncbi:MAG: cytochrome b562 [Akkermansiaceae bacterium]|jgi:soluble cytochrome b562|nr:cytochrome b562 [Akkermansiaceae bacterium]MDP4647365.1 cytochrome b562 [Akkermansiaceae bacterium]MDP4720955.1 cytochrome b562 [Akkermansiaceae bacterium]MDP4779517.1 cytochrome b562 [Akkermansiaceae bacterium]MDP4847335.1 cytochrome b562 [Akkermansiaceae bacterium]
MKLKYFLPAIAASAMFIQPATADEDTPLGEQMEIMNDAYKAFRREEDPEKGAALTREAQDAMIKAISLLPEMVTDMPDGPDKAKAAAKYREMMGQLISTLASIELAFLDGDMEKVAEGVTALRESKKTGHDKYVEE